MINFRSNELKANDLYFNIHSIFKVHNNQLYMIVRVFLMRLEEVPFELISQSTYSKTQPEPSNAQVVIVYQKER